MAVLGEDGGVDVKVWFWDPQKAHPCTEPRLMTYFASMSVVASWLYVISRTQKKDSRVTNGAQSRACAEAKPLIRSE